MNRRLVLACGAAILLSPAALPRADDKARSRIGLIYFGDEASARSLQAALVSGLQNLGYIAGRNLTIDVRYVHGDTARVVAMAEELIALKPDVLLAIEPVASAIRAKTTTIPIVLTASTDPVAAGLVLSLPRPGTNVTGLAYRNDELLAKHIELLAEIVPTMSRLALFNKTPSADDSDARLTARFEEVARRAASAKGLTLAVARAGDPGGVRQAFQQLEGAKPQGLVVAATGVTFQLRHEIMRQARRLRLPSISSLPEAWLEAGGLVNYGPSFLESYRYVATFVDRILKGSSPAVMPVEQPSKFELVLNLKAARELGIAIPQAVTLRADRVIE